MTANALVSRRTRLVSLAGLSILLAGSVPISALPAEASWSLDATAAVVSVPGPDPAVYGLVLNGDSAVVSSAAAGAAYTASISLRALTVPAHGEISVRESTPSRSVEHLQEFDLTGTSWTTVTAPVVTELVGSTLSVAVHVTDGSRVDVGQSMIVRASSAGGGTSCSGTIPSGTVFGSSLSWEGDWSATVAAVDKAFGTVEAVRVWDNGLPEKWTEPRARATAGRTTVISFRPMPQDVVSGKYDAELRAFFATAPSDRTIYWSYIHEPEELMDAGKFTAAQYKAAWRHISAIADSACRPNMFATLILMGWTASPASGKNVADYYPGADVIDVMAWDPYNGVYDFNRDYYASAASIFGDSVAASKRFGKPFAIAETGSRLVAGDDGSGRAAWLTEIGTYLRQHNAVFVTYFNSDKRSNWRLDDTPSQKAWAAQIDLG